MHIPMVSASTRAFNFKAIRLAVTTIQRLHNLRWKDRGASFLGIPRTGGFPLPIYDEALIYCNG